jgi:RNA polymerase sigma factor (sigma-70 family)
MRTVALTEQQRDALERAYREFGADLWRAVYVFALGQKEIADDAVSQAFIEAGPRMTKIRHIRPWLYTVAFRAAAADLRRRQAMSALPSAASHAVDMTHEGVSPMQETLVETLDLARSLSPKQRRVFVLRDLFGYSTGEAARLLGISEIGVRVHLHAAHRRLRTAVEEAQRA